MNIEFLNKWYFLIIILSIFIVFLFFRKLKTWINFKFLEDIKKVFWNNPLYFYFKIILLALILVNFSIILANPNKTNTDQNIKKSWIDIVLALDISWSMEATDLNPSRIEAAKNVLNNFIDQIKTDRVWLVVFAWKPFTSIPLTFDYSILTETIKRLTTNNINQQNNSLQWTAIWDAILMSKTLFDEEKDNREKVIILLTDWDANVWVDPKLAALSAKQEWIKIYTIWIWSEEWWYISYNVWPFVEKQKVAPLNEDSLKEIARETSWEYFRAKDNNTFKEIFQKLEKLDKNEIEVDIKKTYSEYYKPFVISLIILLWLFTLILINDIEIKKD